jgi:hypothetical protein
VQGAFHALSWEEEKVSCDGNAKKDMGRVSTAESTDVAAVLGKASGVHRFR